MGCLTFGIAGVAGLLAILGQAELSTFDLLMGLAWLAPGVIALALWVLTGTTDERTARAAEVIAEGEADAS